MKKCTMFITAVLLCLALALTCWLFTAYARKNGDNLPSVPDVVTQLRNEGEEAATDTLRGYSLDTLKSVWGEPEWELFGMFGCIWGSDGESIIVYFDNHARVEWVKLNERNP